MCFYILPHHIDPKHFRTLDICGFVGPEQTALSWEMLLPILVPGSVWRGLSTGPFPSAVSVGMATWPSRSFPGFQNWESRHRSYAFSGGEGEAVISAAVWEKVVHAEEPETHREMSPPQDTWQHPHFWLHFCLRPRCIPGPPVLSVGLIVIRFCIFCNQYSDMGVITASKVSQEGSQAGLALSGGFIVMDNSDLD